MHQPADRLIRTMTNDGAFRVMALRATATARAACDSQQAHPIAIETFVNAIMGAVLVRETMAPMLRVELMLRDALGNQLVGDAWPEGDTRGLLTVADEILGFRFGEGCLLQVVRNMPRGEQHEGIIETREGAGMAAALEDYFLRSEQVETMVGLCTIVEDERVTSALGYVVQLLPELTDPPLLAMRKRLAGLDLRELGRSGATPEALTEAILGGGAAESGGAPSTLLADSPVTFRCRCSPEKVAGAVGLLDDGELAEMIAKAEPIAVRCEYCGTEYRVLPPQLEQLRQRKARERGDSE